ncbi:hypothetical protein AEYBE204_02370 [Asticcacaulis sp. YBE204]|nr:hypothetical protein AEYBE204_02370 [Asticcacaulis sp. YBE204]
MSLFEFTSEFVFLNGFQLEAIFTAFSIFGAGGFGFTFLRKVGDSVFDAFGTPEPHDFKIVISDDRSHPQEFSPELIGVAKALSNGLIQFSLTCFFSLTFDNDIGRFFGAIFEYDDIRKMVWHSVGHRKF